MVSSQKTGQHKPRLDTSLATSAFIFAALSWVPLFNLFSNPLAIIFAIISIVKQNREPKLYGGFKRAISALVICSVWIILFFYSWFVFGPDVLFRR